MRCPDCQKFVSYDEPVVELTDVQADTEDGGVRFIAELTVTLPCQECNTDLKQATVGIDEFVEHDCEADDDDGESEFEIVREDAEPTSWSDQPKKTVSKTGKVRYTPARFLKTYYGADVMLGAKCSRCDQEIEYAGQVGEAASYFEEVC